MRNEITRASAWPSKEAWLASCFPPIVHGFWCVISCLHPKFIFGIGTNGDICLYVVLGLPLLPADHAALFGIYIYIYLCTGYLRLIRVMQFAATRLQGTQTQSLK